MSRHKLVKNLDLDDELDDFDGGDDYGNDGADGGGEGMVLSLSCRDYAARLLTCLFVELSEEDQGPAPHPTSQRVQARHFEPLLTPSRANANRDHRSACSFTTCR